MSATEPQSAFDSAKAEAFAGKRMAALNNGAVCLMTSIGHRTSLFDVMNGLPPSTSTEIARAAGLNERYVREWLGAMWGEEKTRDYLQRAGFGSIETNQLAHDIQNNWYVVRK